MGATDIAADPGLIPRGRFQGVRLIASLNWPYYALSTALIAALAAACAALPTGGWRWACAAAIGASAWFTIASLVASWWAYDASGLYRWDWLRARLEGAPRRWLALHAGLDEATPDLLALFPGDGRAVDLFDARTMRAGSLLRARTTLTPALAALTPDGTRLPAMDASQDAVFVLFAAHELRDERRRGALFGEIRRVLVPGGVAVLVEHHRDLANWLAYGPGALHFHGRASWLRAIDAGGLAVAEEVPLTPLVRALFLRVRPAR